MNSKAIRKQLLAAVAMVLVAAVALGSSTYAWFVASGTVTATGMKVQAQTDAGLAIRYDNGTWGTSATANMGEAKTLYPTSTLDLRNWYHATAESADNFAAKEGTRSDVTSSVLPSDTYAENSYALMRTFEIRSTSRETKASGLYVSDIRVTAPQKSMSTALRVGVEYIQTVDGNKTYYRKIFAPVTLSPASDPANVPTTSYPVYNAGDVQVGTVAVATPNVKETSNANNAIIIPDTIVIPFSESNNGLNVNIFVWFEGEDHNLNTDNFGAEQLSITVDFTSLKTGNAATTAPTEANKVDLTGTLTVSSSPTVVDGKNYYAIDGKTALDNATPLYSDSTTLTSASKIFAITSGNVVTEYTSFVKLPTTT